MAFQRVAVPSGQMLKYSVGRTFLFDRLRSVLENGGLKLPPGDAVAKQAFVQLTELEEIVTTPASGFMPPSGSARRSGDQPGAARVGSTTPAYRRNGCGWRGPGRAGAADIAGQRGGMDLKTEVLPVNDSIRTVCGKCSKQQRSLNWCRRCRASRSFSARHFAQGGREVRPARRETGHYRSASSKIEGSADSPHRRHDELCLGPHACGPARGDGLEPGVEAHTLGPVHVMVTEERRLPAAERMERHRHRDRRR